MTPAARATLADRLVRAGLVVAHRLLRVYWFVLRPTTRGTYVAVWWRGRILLVQNSYKSYATLPGGALKRGETSAQAAARELREEVGIALAPSDLRLVGEYATVEHHHEDRGTFFEFECSEEPVVAVDGREVVCARFQLPGEALRGALAPLVRQYLSDGTR